LHSKQEEEKNNNKNINIKNNFVAYKNKNKN